MYKIIFCSAFLVFITGAAAQNVGIGTSTPNASARLELNAGNRGLLIPRVSLASITDVTTVPSPVLSLLVFNYNPGITGGEGAGFYAWSGTKWAKIAPTADTWNKNGNSVTTSDFIGTTNAQPIRLKIGGTYAGYVSDQRILMGIGAGENEDTVFTGGYTNLGIGMAALKRNTKGVDNIAIGDSAMYSDASAVYYPHRNIAIGRKALKKHARGGSSIAIGYGSQENFNPSYDYNNIAIGILSLQDNIYGAFNTAIGKEVMALPEDAGNHNTAIGNFSMKNSQESMNCVAIGNSTLFLNGLSGSTDPNKGKNNTAVGVSCMNQNVNGYANTATGAYALLQNNDGYRNTVAGDSVLHENTTGHGNIAMGYQAGIANTSGNLNCFLGTSTAALNTSGDKNVVVGALAYAGTNASTGNTLVGHQAGDVFDMGNNNTLIGVSTDVSADGFVQSAALGFNASITASNQVRIGNVGTSSIGGYQNWSNISDGRYKTRIQNNVPGLDFILKLSPVTYHLDVDGINKALGKAASDVDDAENSASLQRAKARLCTGFIAQDVEALAKKTGYDFSGVDPPKNEKDFYGLRYAEFVVPLVKAVQERQKLIESSIKENELLKAQLDYLLKRIELLERKN